MIDVPATYFDGLTSQPRAVRLRWHAFDQMLEVSGDGLALRVPKRDVAIESRLGRGPRIVRFKGSGHCEIPDSDEVDAIIATWAPQRSGAWIYRVETSWSKVIAATLVMIGLLWAALHFGLPWGARKIAFLLPAETLKQLGDQTMTTLDETMLAPTALTHERQVELERKFREFLAQTGDTAAYRIEFRRMKDGTANAFALPSGVVVLTDDLVRLAGDDREILGVLAHECGHIYHRHAMRSLLQNSTVFIVIALVTGDLSSATAFGGALPAFLLQNRFSREFEREADAHAVETLRRAGIPATHLARMLERLAEKHGDGGSGVLGYLRSHPPTPERIQTISGTR